MVTCPIATQFTNADATSAAAAALGTRLKPGDVVLLAGSVGAGKTHFARSLIQSQLVQPEDVPSPTFTLVQTYDTLIGEVWHADLYRLSSVQDIEELGLIEAFDNAICLIEWPDRLGDLAPLSALTLTLASHVSADSRTLTAHWTDPTWGKRLQGWDP